MLEEYVLAYDLGTSGVKVALVNTSGTMIDYATAEYGLSVPNENWAEQDPEWYWEGVCRATRDVLKKSGVKPENAKGIAFGTQWKGIIPIDKHGKVLHSSIIWLDARAEKQAEKLNEHFRKSIFCASDYWPKLLWLRENEPQVFEQADIILEANSYLKWRASGEAAVDYSNSFVRSFDGKLQEFYNDFLSYCDIDISKFPKLVKCADRVGELKAKPAEEMGLVAGVPVFGGSNDIHAIAVGSGTLQLGGVHVYFGSSGWIGFSLPHSIEDIYISPIDEEKDLSIYGLQSIGLALNWAVDTFYGREHSEMGGDVFDYVNKQVAEIKAGSEGVLVAPWFYGERPPLFSERARGCFLNISAKHDRRHMVRAVMESICYMLKMGGNFSAKKNGTTLPKEINAIGGGACSDVWMQILADVLNVTIKVPKSPRHTGAIGTAYCALVGLGYCKDFAEASEEIEIEKIFKPEANSVEVYKKSFAIFEDLYKALEPIFDRVDY